MGFFGGVCGMVSVSPTPPRDSETPNPLIYPNKNGLGFRGLGFRGLGG